jgi:hypothetical protein
MKVLWRDLVTLHGAEMLVKFLSHLYMMSMPMHFLYRYVMESLHQDIGMFSEYRSFTQKHVNIYINNNSVSEVDDNVVVNPEVGNEIS